MMSISEVIESRREERGISVAELSRRTEVNYDVLSRGLKGISNLKGDQLLRICRELALDFSDFDEFQQVSVQ